jgi:Polyketide cyclase / dehydrase and lipid transport.
MVTAHHSVTAGAPVEALWKRLADLQSWPRWLRVPYATQSVSITSAQRTGLGTEFTMKGQLPYRLFALITEWKELRRLGFEIYRSDYPSDRWFFARASIAVELEPINDRHTVVRCTHILEGRGFLGRLYARIVMRSFLHRNTRQIVGSLKAGI